MTAIHSASSPTPFNLANSPLFGSALIEASAGTGKTYSLAFLYLRFILEAGYSVEEILVTTFTKAAVAELKERLFARLLDVDKILHQQADKTAEPATDSDPFLVTYLQTLAENLPVNELKNGCNKPLLSLTKRKFTPLMALRYSSTKKTPLI